MLTDRLSDVREVLKKMAKYRNIIGEEYSARAYDNAAKIIKDTVVLRRVLDGVDLPKGIGKKIREIVVEFIATGSIKELSSLRADPKIIALERFEKIMGVGPVNALKFVEEGYTSLESLADNPYLTKQQKIGIEYYGKIILRIPRAVITSAFEDLQQIINSLDPGSESIVSGSYRRGSATSGDVDVLIKSAMLTGNDVMSAITTKYAYEPEKIVVISSGEQKIMFLLKIQIEASTKYIQVDMFISRPDEYVAHLNYSTGSAEHNIYLRNAAIKKGLKLSQHGLYNGQKKITITNEQELYNILGVPYVEPSLRN